VPSNNLYDITDQCHFYTSHFYPFQTVSKLHAIYGWCTRTVITFHTFVNLFYKPNAEQERLLKLKLFFLCFCVF